MQEPFPLCPGISCGEALEDAKYWHLDPENSPSSRPLVRFPHGVAFMELVDTDKDGF